MTTLRIAAVAFDVFGTLVRIGERRRPYRRLQQLMAKYGRPSQPGDAELMMSSNVWPAGLIKQLGVELPAWELAEVEDDLHAELATVGAYSDAIEAILSVRGHGFRVGLCSNLAKPYSIARASAASRAGRLFMELRSWCVQAKSRDLCPPLL